MSSATNVVGILPYMTQSAAATNVSSTTGQNNKNQAQVSFDNVLIKVTDTVVKTTKTEVKITTNKAQVSSKDDTKADDVNAKATTKADVNANTKADNKVSDNNQQAKPTDKESAVETKETTGMEANDKLQESITEDAKTLVNELIEMLDIDEEDLLDAMEILGLSIIDLLNTDNIQQIVALTSGQEKALDLITDSELYTSLQDLLEGADSMRSQLMNEYDLSEEDLDQVITQESKNFSELLNGENAEEIEAPIVTPKAAEEQVKVEEPKVVIETEEPTEAVTIKAPEHSNNEHKQNNANKDTSNGSDPSQALFNQIVDNIAEATQAVTRADSFSYTDRAQMENIIRQITEKITILNTETQTSMELQLHPASLGNVNVLLTSSKDGIVAKFTAQNEIVKEAVESQMVQLQQKFSEQGIKVTSIEVTIASHAFEQNLQQDDPNQKAQEQMGRQKKSIRRINLSELEEIPEEELEDEDRLAAQMMAMNGNTVDYSA